MPSSPLIAGSEPWGDGLAVSRFGCRSREGLVRQRRPVAPPPMPERGYARLYRNQVLQADRGCDFDFLRKHPTGLAAL
jgi:hypothetical protein